MFDRTVRGALGAALLFSLVACSEQVTSSLGCPELCTDQSATLRDTVLDATVVLDTTLLGFPELGSTSILSLVARGDTADVRVVARFDTLPNTYRLVGATADSVIRRVDSASMIFVIDTFFSRPKVPVTIDAFDVDTTAQDTLRAALVPLFRADRLLGSATFQPSELKDTLRLPLDNTALFTKIANNQRLRIGLKLRSAESATLRVSGAAMSPRIRFRVSADTSVKPDTVFLRSMTPVDDPATAGTLTLFPVFASGMLPPPPAGRLAVGGIAGARSYLRFDIPPIVLDSVQIIRASLELTQVSSRSAGGNRDTLTLLTQAVVAGPAVTDIATSMRFLAPFGVFPVDTLRLIPAENGVRSVELVNVVRAWRAVGTANTQRAIVISAFQEASSPGELNFFSIEGPAAVRPRLRLTYVPRRGFGIP